MELEIFLKAGSMFISVMTICALTITTFYMLDVMDKMKKRKDESGKEK